jgi:hypothetical protein
LTYETKDQYRFPYVPARHAAQLATRPVYLARAFLDRVIPAESFEVLRTAIPTAAVHTYATGHESFVYVMPSAVDRALDWAGHACSDRAVRRRAIEVDPLPMQH